MRSNQLPALPEFKVPCTRLLCTAGQTSDLRVSVSAAESPGCTHERAFVTCVDLYAHKRPGGSAGVCYCAADCVRVRVRCPVGWAGHAGWSSRPGGSASTFRSGRRHVPVTVACGVSAARQQHGRKGSWGVNTILDKLPRSLLGGKSSWQVREDAVPCWTDCPCPPETRPCLSSS